MKAVVRSIFGFVVFLFGLLLTGFVVFHAFAVNTTESQYSAKIYECIDAAKRGQAKTIQDFVCPEGVSVSQDIAYQVVLDLEFQKIDKEVKASLKAFQELKGKDVLKMNEQIKDWFDLTGTKPGYLARYLVVCNDLSKDGNPLRETIKAFFWGVSTGGSTANFLEWQTACSALAQAKVDAYRDIALLIATGNVTESYSDDRTQFTDKLKDQYERFLTEWMQYIGELARITDKWPSKTKIQNHE